MHLSTRYLLPLCLLNRVYETLFISGSGVYSGGVLDISFGGEVRLGPSYSDPVKDKNR